VPGAGRAESTWDNTVAIYGFLTNMDGTLTVGEVDSPVNVDADQVLEKLEFAAMARYRGQTDRWAFVVDGIFAGLGGTREGTVAKQDLELDLLVVQADAAYRFSQNAEFLFGARYVRFDSQLDTTSAAGVGQRRENDATLFDPVVGLRTLNDLGEKWRLQSQVDVGGGGDSELTWQAMIHLGYQPSDGYSFWLGYRALSLDFDNSGGRNRFGADMILYGPVLGAAFHF